MQQSPYWAELDAEGQASGLLAPPDFLAALAGSGLRTTRDGIPVSQILADRPDVFRAFFDEFYGGGHDRHSAAWSARVGGVTVEDYANYWYEQHGRWEGYGSGSDGGGGAAAPLEPEDMMLPPGIVETGRTVAEGYRISQILAERPDVFRAFFTEFYGRNNDRNSDAWVNRVGGDTVEDYANYWWETYGRASGWTPGRSSGSAPDEDGLDELDAPQEVARPLVVEYTEDGVILRHPEPDDIIEDGVVVGRRPTDGVDGDPNGEPASAPGLPSPETMPEWDPWEGLARPLVMEYRADGGFDLRPATTAEIMELAAPSVFETDPFG